MGPEPAVRRHTLATPLARALRWALAAAALAAPPARADSLRCDGGLVSAGDTKLDLLGKCGRPALAESRPVERAGTLLTPGPRVQASRTVSGTVETWTYNFGPRRFTSVVTLEGGRVVRVERGGYGYDLPDAGGPAFIPRARCDYLALREGDRAFDLLARCGEPASRDVAVVTRRVAVLAREEPPGRREAGAAPGRGPRRERGPGGAAVVEEAAEAVTVEVWAYDFGPQVLVRLVELEDGVVTRVDTGSHGYSRP